MTEKVIEIIARELMVDESEVLPQSNLTDDLGADSLALVDLAMALEDEFDVQISDDDLEEIKTVSDILNYLTKRTEG